MEHFRPLILIVIALSCMEVAISAKSSKKNSCEKHSENDVCGYAGKTVKRCRPVDKKCAGKHCRLECVKDKEKKPHSEKSGKTKSSTTSDKEPSNHGKVVPARTPAPVLPPAPAPTSAPAPPTTSEPIPALPSTSSPTSAPAPTTTSEQTPALPSTSSPTSAPAPATTSEPIPTLPSTAPPPSAPAPATTSEPIPTLPSTAPPPSAPAPATDCPNGFSDDFDVKLGNMLNGWNLPIDTEAGMVMFVSATLDECKAHCIANNDCRSFNYDIDFGACWLNSETRFTKPSDFMREEFQNYYGRQCRSP